MEREGASLADRPVSIAAGETLSGGMRVLLTPAGERFKKMRKSVSLYPVVCQPPLTAVVLRDRALHTHLQPKIVQTYAPVLMENAKRHLFDVLGRPEIHQEHAKRSVPFSRQPNVNQQSTCL